MTTINPTAPAVAAAKPTATPAPASSAPTPPPPASTRPGRLPSDVLKQAVQGALQVDPQARFAIDRASNSATFLTGSFKVDLKPGASKGAPDKVASEFLTRHGQLFGIADPKADLKLAGIDKDDLGYQHFRYQQMHDGLPVFGQQVVVHAQDRLVRSVGGRLTPNIGSGADPKVDLDAALASVRGSLPKGLDGTEVQATDSTLGYYTAADGRPRLSYEMTVENKGGDNRWRYYVDARSGKVLDSWNLIETALNHETYDAQNGSSRPGKLARKGNDAPIADDVVNKAHDNARAVYEYYNTLFGRDSLDNKGMKLTSTVHYGTKYNNAYWDGRQMTYGDGDGERFTPFGNALDVVGHEMAHGVTEKTASLRYFKQSGALNESWSDTFGNLIEKWDERRQTPDKPERDPKWLVGEQIFTPKIDGDGLRSMSQPGTGYPNDPQPGHMKDYKNIDYDNGGVHINSGIPNKAAFEVGQKIGPEKLSRIWYRALSNYMTGSSQFGDAANVTVQSAADLYGKDSPEVKAVQEAWTSVGLPPSAAPGISG